MESENLSIPACWFTHWISEVQRSLSDTSVLLQRIREADAPLKVYVECVEMERNFLCALGIVENIQTRKHLIEALLGEGALDWSMPHALAY